MNQKKERERKNCILYSFSDARFTEGDRKGGKRAGRDGTPGTFLYRELDKNATILGANERAFNALPYRNEVDDR